MFKAKELKEYLRTLGADIEAENKDELYDDVSDIIAATESLWKTTDDRGEYKIHTDKITRNFVDLCETVRGICILFT